MWEEGEEGGGGEEVCVWCEWRCVCVGEGGGGGEGGGCWCWWWEEEGDFLNDSFAFSFLSFFLKKCVFFSFF